VSNLHRIFNSQYFMNYSFIRFIKYIYIFIKIFTKYFVNALWIVCCLGIWIYLYINIYIIITFLCTYSTNFMYDLSFYFRWIKMSQRNTNVVRRLDLKHSKKFMSSSSLSGMSQLSHNSEETLKTVVHKSHKSDNLEKWVTRVIR